MSEQLAITGAELEINSKPARAAKPLTRNQQLAFDYVRTHDGVTADEVGAYIHAHRDRRPHSVDERCEWCAKTGRQTLTSKALKPLVTYRRAPEGHLYVARNPADRDEETAQRDELPGETWEDMFR